MSFFRKRPTASKAAAVALAGFLVPHIAVAAPEPLRGATFGTSLTAQGLWQPALRSALERCRRGQPVEIINLGGGGKDARWGLDNAARVAATHPDFILIEFSINDAFVQRRISPAESEELTRRIIHLLKAAAPHSKIYLMTMNPTHGAVAWVRPALDAYYDLYRHISREEHVGLIDVRPRWDDRPDLEQLIPDGVHPTVGAVDAVLVPTVLRALSSRWCG